MVTREVVLFIFRSHILSYTIITKSVGTLQQGKRGRNMKRKLISLFLAAAMVSSALAGCGGSKDSAKTDDGKAAEETTDDAAAEGKSDNAGKTLNIMCYLDPEGSDATELAILNDIYAKFTEDTGIEIEYTTVPWDQTESKVVITNQAGSPSDVALVSSQKLASLVNAYALMPLDEMIDKDMKRDEISDAVWNAGTYSGDGKTYCMLASVHTRGIWYNKDLVSEPPKTWDELVEIGQNVMKEHEGVYGFGTYATKHYATGECTLAPFVWAGEGKLTNDDGSAAWATQETADAIQFLSDLYNEYKIMPEMCTTFTDYADVGEQFKAGNIAMVTDGSYARKNYEEALGDKADFAPLPAKTEGGPAPHFSNGWAWAIPSKAKNPDLAWEWIKWFYQKDIQVNHSKIEGGLPTTLAAQADPVFAEGLNKKFIDNVNANGKSMDPFLYYQEGLEELSVAAASYILDPSADLNKLLEDSQNRFNEKYYSK